MITNEYDVPPQLVRGDDAIKRALNRVLKSEDIEILKNKQIHLLINEKGKIEDMRIESAINNKLQQNLLKALKLMKWNPAMYEDLPVKVWTILIIPDMQIK